jgi:hypothetical protein
MTASIALAVWLVGGAGATARPATDVSDPPLQWVRAVVHQDVDTITRLTSVPFQFRTTSADRKCEGWVRSKKALREWAACVSARTDVQQLKALLDADGVVAQSGWASAGMGTPRADDIALKISGSNRWSQWRAVSVSHLWTTFQIRLLDGPGRRPINVEAAIIDAPER